MPAVLEDKETKNAHIVIENPSSGPVHSFAVKALCDKFPDIIVDAVLSYGEDWEDTFYAFVDKWCHVQSKIIIWDVHAETSKGGAIPTDTACLPAQGEEAGEQFRQAGRISRGKSHSSAWSSQHQLLHQPQKGRKGSRALCSSRFDCARNENWRRMVES